MDGGDQVRSQGRAECQSYRAGRASGVCLGFGMRMSEEKEFPTVRLKKEITLLCSHLGYSGRMSHLRRAVYLGTEW